MLIRALDRIAKGKFAAVNRMCAKYVCLGGLGARLDFVKIIMNLDHIYSQTMSAMNLITWMTDKNFIHAWNGHVGVLRRFTVTMQLRPCPIMLFFSLLCYSLIP